MANITYAYATDVILTLDRYAHLIGGAHMGTGPDTGVVDSDHQIWVCRTWS